MVPQPLEPKRGLRKPRQHPLSNIFSCDGPLDAADDEAETKFVLWVGAACRRGDHLNFHAENCHCCAGKEPEAHAFVAVLRRSFLAPASVAASARGRQEISAVPSALAVQTSVSRAAWKADWLSFSGSWLFASSRLWSGFTT